METYGRASRCPLNLSAKSEIEIKKQKRLMLQHNRSPFPLGNQDTQTTIVMAKKNDTDMTSEAYRQKVTVGSKSIAIL